MLFSFYTPKNSKSKTVDNVVSSTSFGFREDYTEEEGLLLYTDSIDYLDGWWECELSDGSNDYRFVFKGGKNDIYSENDMYCNGREYYPPLVTPENVTSFNESYMMAYHLAHYIEIKSQLHKNSLAYETLHIWDGGGFQYDGNIMEAKEEYDRLVKELFENFNYEF